MSQTNIDHPASAAHDPVVLVLPRAIFLRDRQGAPIGPLPLRSAEVLFDTRIIDERTPVSLDGATFAALASHPEVLARVLEIKQLIVSGVDPWGESTMPEAAAPVAPPLTDPVDLAGRSPVRVMFECAARRATGELRLTRPDGEIALSYAEGKVVAVDTTISSLSLGEFLVRRGLCTAKDVETAKARAPAMGGDLGSSLISLGFVAPHTFVERTIEWAHSLLGAAVASASGSAAFEDGAARAAAVPLGLDRFGVLLEAVRAGLARSELETRLDGKLGFILIPSQAEGASVDDLKLDPRELRAFRKIDGTRSVGDVVGTGSERSEQALRAVYVLTELGMVALGDDPETPRERDEAKKLRQLHKELKEQTYYEILGVAREAPDQEVRARYMELAKTYHPDRARSTAAHELLEARSQVFALVQEAFHGIQSQEARATYDAMLGHGIRAKSEEQAVVSAAVEAETAFKKAEALVRMKKYEDALEMLDRAIELNPADTEFKVHRLFVRFLTDRNDRERAAATATHEILILLKAEPKIASAYLFLGRMAKVINDPDSALRHFRKVLEFDPKNHEAESEVRLITMRKEKRGRS